MKVVFDTNILIDYLKGIEKANEVLNQYEDIHISIISWIELLVGAKDEYDETIIRQFLHMFSTQFITTKIAERSIQIRKQKRIRLPDAIIWATAHDLRCILVTRNQRDFPADDPSIHIPYQL
ncbi:MAG: type II toxin-antitoxin system VapC family toxin [Candidatus Omnitrophota bacterium]|nr:MAG: type II toxin-antitoxin system VapC family toxin [Candidatus Omnitrophota bacterium]